MQRRERICPISGPGLLTRPEIERRAKEIIAASGADTVEHFEKCEAFGLDTTFLSKRRGGSLTSKQKSVVPLLLQQQQDTEAT